MIEVVVVQPWSEGYENGLVTKGLPDCIPDQTFLSEVPLGEVPNPKIACACLLCATHCSGVLVNRFLVMGKRRGRISLFLSHCV